MDLDVTLFDRSSRIDTDKWTPNTPNTVTFKGFYNFN